MVASDSLRNKFAQQMFTLQQNNMVPETILKNLSQQKDALETRLATKIMSSSSLFSFFHSLLLAWQIALKIFISNVLLKNPTETNA